MLACIDRRTHNQYAMEASLHGIKIPLRYNTEQLVAQDAATFDPSEQTAIDKAFEETKARMKRAKNG